MQVEVKIDELYQEPKVVIFTEKITTEISELVLLISEGEHSLSGKCDDRVSIIKENEIIKIYSENRKIFASTKKGEFQLGYRLYEVEEKLDRTKFVRISHSEIINLNYVDSFDLSLSGTIKVLLLDGTESYVSRRFVSKIKRVLEV